MNVWVAAARRLSEALHLNVVPIAITLAASVDTMVARYAANDAQRFAVSA